MDEVRRDARLIWDYMLMRHELKSMDAVFALGSSDTRVAEWAADLFLQGLGEYLILAGKYGKVQKFAKTEAETFGDIARERGVPGDKIILETRSTNTGENILFVKELLAKKNLDIKSFLLVQKPYMERRTYATFKKQWPEAECIVNSPPISYDEYGNDSRFHDRWIDIMVGDLQRIKEYPALGYQIEQNIPEQVWEAYERLVGLGYTKYMIQEHGT